MADLAQDVADALAEMPAGTKVLFTDGSDGDPDALRRSAEHVADRLGLAPWAGWGVAQGPRVLDVIRGLAATGRATGVLVCPCGVAAPAPADARGLAESAGLAFRRLER